MIYNQHEFDIRLEWGMGAIEMLAPICDVIIIVDILSFSTCVSIATQNGAIVYPYRWKDESAIAYAENIGAELADLKRKFTDGFSLSPTSLLNIPAHHKLVLASPNGATLSLATQPTPTLCGSLRKAKAVAIKAQTYGRKIGIIATGEQWPDGSIRVAFEDLLGAGAIISYLPGTLSPESKTGLILFEHLQATLYEELKKCSSGKELIARGFEKDIILAADFNISNTVPVLQNNAYVGFQIDTK